MLIRILATLCIVLAPVYAAAQTSDTTPPELIAFDFDPKSIDVTVASQAVSITATLEDDLSGPGGIYVSFNSPTLGQQHAVWLSWVGATGLQAMYAGELEMPMFVESGTWNAEISAYDQTGNWVYLDSSNLAALGFSSELQVTSNPDTTPPSIVSATATPAAIDVSGGDQAVTIDMRIIDDVSGVDFDGSPYYYVAYIGSPNLEQQYAISYREFEQISGSAVDQVRRIVWTMPQHSAPGTWTLQMALIDNAGNQAWSADAATFDVVSNTPDLAPPSLMGFGFSPLVIDTSAGPANVTVSLDLSDDATGVDLSLATPTGGYFHGVVFSSPSGQQGRSACCGAFSMTAGTVLNGTWQAQVYFPQYSEAGTWAAWLSGITDHVRNRLTVSSDELAANGFEYQLVVVRPSLEGDGQVGPSGGTVVDETFPDRAQVTFPPGAVSGETDVAIDVFPDPLAIPLPEGYQAAGSFFVNIDLTPEPNYPFPNPGVTLILPLPDYINPGTSIPLYSVDPDTGLLVPMVRTDGAGGGPVVGTVNLAGLSATFTGIAHFTIVVGLIPDTIEVGIDIKPGKDINKVNKINPNKKGDIDVAVLGAAGFDVVQIDETTLRFGPSGAQADKCKAKDENKDGLDDLSCKYETLETGIVCGDTSVTLNGSTYDGQAFIGSDAIDTSSKGSKGSKSSKGSKGSKGGKGSKCP